MKYNDNGEWKDIQVKVANAIQNEYGESNNDGYSQNYLNDRVVNVGTEVDDTYRVNLIKGNNLFDKDNIDGYVGLNATLTTTSNGVRATATTTGQYLQAIVIIKDATNMVGESVSVKGNFTASSSNTGRITIGLCDNEGGNRNGLVHITTSGNSGNATIPSISGDAKYLFIAFYANNDGTSTTNSYVDYTNVMLNLGSTALPYEAFMQNSMQVDGTKFTDTLNVGSLEDNRNRVNLLHSKNLFDISKRYYDNVLSQNVSISLENGVFSANISSGSAHTGFKIPVEIGEEYTIKWTEATGLNSVQTDYFRDYNTSATRTITATTNVLDIRFLSSGSSLTINNLQIEKGSTATSYSPFIPNQIVVDNEKYSDTLNVGASLDSRSRVNVLHSKNLFDETFRQGSWFNLTSTDRISSTHNLYLKAGTYTISTDIDLSTYNYSIGVATFTIPSLTSPDIYDSGWISVANQTITMNRSGYVYIIVKKTSGANITPSDISSVHFQIQSGSTATSYEPYVVPSIYVDNEMLVSKNVYSTGEVVIGEWLGKPLYRKVVTISSLPNNTNVEYDIFSNTSEIDTCWVDVGMSYVSLSNNSLKYPVNWIWTTSAYMFTGMNGKKLRVKTTENQSANSGYFVINYTKTTD